MNITKRLSERNSNIFQSTPVVIACLGDSVTHGCFEVYTNRFGNIETVYEQESGYTAGLRRSLTTLYPAAAVSVINAGISGDNAPNGLKRLENDVLRHAPDLVTVNYGLNDSCRGMEGLDDYRNAMDGIFGKLQDAGIECMLVTPNRMCSYVAHGVTGETLKAVAANCAKTQNEGILDAYIDAARDVAKKRGIPVADAYRTWNDMERCGVDTTALLSNDINHPTREMHRIFVEKILEKIFEGGSEE